MINRLHRFHGINSLRHVYSRGQTVRGPLIAVKYLFNNKRHSYRAAVVVSRKVHKSAVVRNRIRRRIYEYIRTHAASIDKPIDIVVTVFSDQVATTDSPTLAAMLDDQFERAGLFAAPTTGAEHAIVEQITLSNRPEHKEKT